MDKYEKNIINSIWFLSKCSNIDDYLESKKNLAYNFTALCQIIKEMSENQDSPDDIESQTKSIRFMYTLYGTEILKNISVCIRVIWENDRAKFNNYLSSIGYFSNNVYRTKKESPVGLHLEHLTTCKKWVDNMDCAFPREFMAQFHTDLPEIVDNLSYSKVNVCAVLKIFLFCLFIGDFK